MIKRTKCELQTNFVLNPLTNKYLCSKCTRGRKSRQYYELMRKYEEEGNLEMIEHLKVHGTKAIKSKKSS